MGGIGVGSSIYGKLSDTNPRPLRLYGRLECGIAAAAAVSPFLLEGVARLYIGTGGSATLGPIGATLLRLVLAALVLGAATFLMGGTLSAAVRAVTTSDDPGRRRAAILYAMNTAGAVVGVLVSGFLLIEKLGNRQTLWLAAAVNLAIGVVAVASGDSASPEAASEVRKRSRAPVVPRAIALQTAFGTGLVFLLMELVWYRMLSPILGGTTYMFALVLAVALAGIGLGGAFYAWWQEVSAGALAVVLAAGALSMAIPFALGDRIALLARALRSGTNFGADAAGWALVTAVVVLPAAVFAGIQFPLLIALLGRGREGVGSDVGDAYAWNTAGAIAGSLVGGFILIPRLGAIGCWRLCAVILAALAARFAWRARSGNWRRLAVAAAAGAIAATFAAGPTAVWRHSGIGAGRAPATTGRNESRAWELSVRRTVLAEAEGRESSIALISNDDLGLIVNGKSDGSARRDAGTQIMAGMIAALLHHEPRSALVVGLGTGTTAGWLAAVPSMERVHVVELEPAVVDLAHAYTAVNQSVLSNPRVTIELNDAREALLVSRQRYDIIFSEPSNPYRAGVASLYTREFYEAVRRRLNDGGMFAQWLQTYSIDAPTAQTIYATLGAVFPHVQTWTTNPGDVVLVASAKEIAIDAGSLRARLAKEPFRRAAHVAWRAESLEGVLAHLAGTEAGARSFAARAGVLNTDDRAVIEFGFARSLSLDSFQTGDIVAAEPSEAVRRRIRGVVDWDAVLANRASLPYLAGDDPRGTFARMYAAAEFGSAALLWRKAPWPPLNSRQLASLGHVLALAGDEEALSLADRIRRWEPVEADAIVAMLRIRQGRLGEGAPLLVRALEAYRSDPWPLAGVMESAISAAPQLADLPDHGEAIVEALSRPYAAYQLDEVRRMAFVAAAWRRAGCGGRTIAALRASEPHPIWSGPFLQMRSRCYAEAGLTQLADRAQRDLVQFEQAERAAASLRTMR